jgi:hypothetical protein
MQGALLLSRHSPVSRQGHAHLRDSVICFSLTASVLVRLNEREDGVERLRWEQDEYVRRLYVSTTDFATAGSIGTWAEVSTGIAADLTIVVGLAAAVLRGRRMPHGEGRCIIISRVDDTGAFLGQPTKCGSSRSSR